MSNTNPFDWARDKRGSAQRYAQDRHIDVMRKARDVAMPGVPIAALIGVACNGKDDENTTGWIVGDDAERAEALRTGKKPLGGDPREGYGHVGSKDLYELGRFGVEASHYPSLVATGDCPWCTLARGELVHKILDRAGVEGRAWRGAIADQIAIGVACIVRHAHAVNKRLHPNLQWEEDGDGAPKVWNLWPFFCGVSGRSAGDGGAERHLDRYADKLGPLPPGHRVGAFLRLAGEVDDPGMRHAQDEYTALRWSQKREAMWLALTFTNEGDAAKAFLDDGIGDDRAAVYDALVRTCQ